MCRLTGNTHYHRQRGAGACMVSLLNMVSLVTHQDVDSFSNDSRVLSDIICKEYFSCGI